MDHLKNLRKNVVDVVVLMFRITYHVKIGQKEYEFYLDLKEDKQLLLLVPDCGGQVDMVPKFPEQFEWTEKNLANMKKVNRIWPTVWELKDEDVIQEIEHLFSEKAKLVKKERLDY